MAKKNTQVTDEARQEVIDAKIAKAQDWLDNNKKYIYYVIGAIVVVALLVLGYSKLIYQPKAAEAMEQAFPAELNFQNNEFELALNGDGNVLGFADVIDTYGKKAGKATYLYAGICELQLGNFQEALGYLKKYNGKEPILAARAKACEGDAYIGLENYSAAVKCYEAAMAKGDNMLAAPYCVKAGLAYEKLGNNAKALECYKTVKDRYPQSVEAYDIDRYISRIGE